jgi:D-alanine-D-alanine ligase
MKVALRANIKQNAPTWPEKSSEQWADLNSWETIQAIAIALEKGGHRVTFLEGDKSLYNNLDAVHPDICFNLCWGHSGDSRTGQVPAILELLRIPYTGSPLLTLAITEDNPMTRRMLIYHGLPTPAFQVFEHEDETLNARLYFPLRVKASRAETGLNIRTETIVHDQSQLHTQLRHVIDRYRHPALVEQYIEGRRITVGLVGNLTTPSARHIPDDEKADRIFQGLHIFPPLEVNAPAYQPTDSVHNTMAIPASGLYYPCLSSLSDNHLEDLKWLAASTFRVMGCLDAACIDFQLDAKDNDKPYILNVNPLPDLNPDFSDLYLAAKANHWPYDGLVNRILDEAIQRYQLKSSRRRPLVRPELETVSPM